MEKAVQWCWETATWRCLAVAVYITMVGSVVRVRVVIVVRMRVVKVRMVMVRVVWVVRVVRVSMEMVVRVRVVIWRSLMHLKLVGTRQTLRSILQEEEVQPVSLTPH